jgi:oxygen-independent coproporphyrinogen-3 oxidase
MEEFMFLGLRMTEGIREEEFAVQFGLPLGQVYGNVLEKYEKTGFLEYQDGFWRFTRKGIHVSNPILAEFLE